MRKVFVLIVAIAIPLLSSCATGESAAQSAEPIVAERILVFGASGRSGQYLIKSLQNQDRSFVAVTSNVQRAQEKVGADIAWVEAVVVHVRF